MTSSRTGARRCLPGGGGLRRCAGDPAIGAGPGREPARVLGSGRQRRLRRDSRRLRRERVDELDHAAASVASRDDTPSNDTGCERDNNDDDDDNAAASGHPAARPSTIGDKNFTEQFILGELYFQALTAEGFNVDADAEHRHNVGDGAGAGRSHARHVPGVPQHPSARRSRASRATSATSAAAYRGGPALGR